MDWGSGFQGAAGGAAAGSSIMPGWGTAIGGGLGFLGGLFGGGGGGDPYDAGKKYYDKIPETLRPYFDPYINAGKDSLGKSQGQYNDLTQDPSGMYNKMAGGYKESPGYQWQLGQGQNAMNNAAAAGGLAGTPQHQQQSAQMAQGIASQDFNNYLQQVMGLYGRGLNGMDSMNKMGFDASTGMGQLLGTNLMNQGNMAMAGQMAQNQSRGQGMGNMMGMFGSMFGNGWGE
jgi:hypothetical protein